MNVIFVGINNPYYPSYIHGLQTLKKISNVICFDYRDIFIKYGKEYMNAYFLDIIEDSNPDIIFFWSISEDFDLETFTKIKLISPMSKTLMFFGDDDSMYNTYSDYYKHFFDYILVCQKNNINDYKKAGKKVFFSYCVNLDNFYKLNIDKVYDVTFIGIPEFNREDYLNYLIRNNINVNIFGRGWEKTSLKEYGNGTINDKEYNKIMNQSKIVLCFSKNKLGKPHYKGRYFETMASGSFMLMEENNTIDEFKNVVKFKNKKDLLKKVKYFLKNEKKREEIAFDNLIESKKVDFSKDLEKIFDKISYKESIEDNPHFLGYY